MRLPSRSAQAFRDRARGQLPGLLGLLPGRVILVFRFGQLAEPFAFLTGTRGRRVQAGLLGYSRLGLLDRRRRLASRERQRLQRAEPLR